MMAFRRLHCPHWVWAGLMLLSCPVLVSAQWAQDRTLTIDLNPQVKHTPQLFRDGHRGVVLITNNGGQPAMAVDGHTGAFGPVTREKYVQLSLVEDYEASELRSDTYLARLGCRAWRFCSGLESTDFIWMVRPGSSANQLALRYLDFTPTFEAVQSALSGRSRDTKPLSADDLLAVDFATRGRWRSRFRDAIRSIDSLERVQTLIGSPIVAQLATLGSMANIDDKVRGASPLEWTGFGLEHEIGLATCRSIVKAFATAALAKSGQGTAEFLSGIRPTAAGGNGCNHLFEHIVDWLDSYPNDDKRKLIGYLQAAVAATRSEDGAQLVRLLAKVGTDDPAVALKRPPPVRQPQPPGSAQPPVSAPSEMQRLSDRDLAVFEFSAIKNLSNQLVLFSFNELNSVLQRDASSNTGSILRSMALDPKGDMRVQAQLAGPVQGGAFTVDVFNGPNSPIKMAKGDYRVKLNLQLTVVRVETCEQLIYCLLAQKETRVTEKRTETVELSLNRQNGHRQLAPVKFGPLLRPDVGETGSLKSRLAEVRLSIDLADRVTLY
jgi:hypothetical protein